MKGTWNLHNSSLSTDVAPWPNKFLKNPCFGASGVSQAKNNSPNISFKFTLQRTHSRIVIVFLFHGIPQDLIPGLQIQCRKIASEKSTLSQRKGRAPQPSITWGGVASRGGGSASQGVGGNLPRQWHAHDSIRPNESSTHLMSAERVSFCTSVGEQKYSACPLWLKLNVLATLKTVNVITEVNCVEIPRQTLATPNLNCIVTALHSLFRTWHQWKVESPCPAAASSWVNWRSQCDHLRRMQPSTPCLKHSILINRSVKLCFSSDRTGFINDTQKRVFKHEGMLPFTVTTLAAHTTEVSVIFTL